MRSRISHDPESIFMPAAKWLLLGLILASASGCKKATAPGPGDLGSSGGAGTPITAQPTAGTLPSAGTGIAGAGIAGVGGATSGAGGAAAASGDLPCPVADFLQLHCVECHGHTPRMGAPISLTDAASFAMPRNGQTVAALAANRVQSADRPMPPAMLLAATETAPFVQWLGAGATPAANGCKLQDPFDVDAGAGSAAGSGASGSASPPQAGSSAPTGTAEPADWPMFGGDLGDSRDNPAETTINASNVSMLKELWTFKGASNTATPAIVGGVAYFGTWDGKVHALDALTGAKIWETTLPDLIDSSPAVAATQVFVSDDNGALHALDRSSGMVLWSKQVDPHAEAHLWSSPLYIESAGLVVVGVASGEEQTQPPYSFRGSVVGYEAATGTERWRFYTTEGDGSSGPGTAVWATAVADTTRQMIYIGTGNAYEGTAGKYVDSMLAIHYDTGMLGWAHQFTAGDVFSIYGNSIGSDFDVGASANMFQSAGKDVLGVSIKSGDYSLLDRETGTPIWTTHISAGSSMGGMIASAAYGEGMVFVASNTFPAPQQTVVAALDAQRGSVVWMQTIAGGLVYGGVLHANGVVYAGSTSAVISAFDPATGKVLWKATAPDSIAGGPCISHGILYVPWGYTWTLREGSAGSGGLTAYGLK
jgi:polyvinyl alcohol dehydrogenase (cytochrome)